MGYGQNAIRKIIERENALRQREHLPRGIQKEEGRCGLNPELCGLALVVVELWVKTTGHG
jgi:hypothetical protein